VDEAERLRVWHCLDFSDLTTCLDIDDDTDKDWTVLGHAEGCYEPAGKQSAWQDGRQ